MVEVPNQALAAKPEKNDIDAAKERRERTGSGDKAINEFTVNYPKPDQISDFYNNITAEGYDEWAVRVNFCEPYEIINEVDRLIKDEAVLQLTTTSHMLDCGAGTGLLGDKLKQKGL